MMQAVRYGLFAPPALQAMLSREPDVMKHVQAFANDAAEPTLEIAGPPLPDEMARARKYDQTVPLPCVRIHMRKAKHHLTGAPLIEIACAEEDLVELERWNLVAIAKARRAMARVN